MTALPVIDAAPLAGSPERLRAVGRAIGEACRDTGFFYVRGGPAAALREQVFAAAHAFFAAEPAVKEAVSIRHSPHNRGYVGMAVEALDPQRGPDRPPLYPPITAADDLRQRLDATYGAKSKT